MTLPCRLDKAPRERTIEKKQRIYFFPVEVFFEDVFLAVGLSGADDFLALVLVSFFLSAGFSTDSFLGIAFFASVFFGADLVAAAFLASAAPAFF